MSIWQAKSWGKFLVSSGQAEEIFDVSGIQVEKRRVSLGEYGLFALGISEPPSPLIRGDLEKLCKQHNCLFVQVETLDYTPPLSPPCQGGEHDIPLLTKEGIGVVRGDWKQNYYKKFITPYTAVIDLTKSEDEILAAMKPKGRYNIKLARKKGVEVIQSDKSPGDIEDFYRLMEQTTSRDSFAGNNLTYYEKFLTQNKKSSLLLAKKDDVVIAAGIFIFEKEVAIYYYGASTSDKQYRNLMAPYLLQWEAMNVAKKLGSKLYDFLGVAHPLEKNSSLVGVTNFKKKLTSDIREVSQSFLFINKKTKYFLIQILRKLKK